MEIEIKKKSWKDFSIKDFYILNDIYREDIDEEDKVIKIISLLSDTHEEIIRCLPMQIFNQLLNDTSFIHQPMPEVKVDKRFKWNDTKYDIYISPNKFAVAQYLDLTAYLKHDAKFHEIISSILVPKGHKYGEGYDVQELQEKILNEMDIATAKSIVNFWSAHLQKYIKDILLYLQYQVSQMKEEEMNPTIKAKMEEITKQLQELTTHSIFGHQ